MTLAHVPRTRIDTCPTCKLSVLFEKEAPGKWVPGKHLAPCGTACFGGGVSDDLFRLHAVHGSRAFPCPKGCMRSSLVDYLNLYETLSGLEGEAYKATYERLEKLYENMAREDQESVSAHRVTETLKKRKSPVRARRE